MTFPFNSDPKIVESNHKHENTLIEVPINYCYGCNNWMDIILSRDEIKTLYELLEHEYISYENIKAIDLVKKLRSIVYDDMVK